MKGVGSIEIVIYRRLVSAVHGGRREGLVSVPDRKAEKEQNAAYAMCRTWEDRKRKISESQMSKS